MMERREKLLRLALPLLLSMLALVFATAGNPAQGGMITASGTLSGSDRGGYVGSMAGTIQLSFPRDGGEVTGSFSADAVVDKDGITRDSLIYLTLDGDFAGFPDGAASGTISGQYTDVFVADQVHKLLLAICQIEEQAPSAFGAEEVIDPRCDNPQPDYDFHTRDVSGTWQGQLNEGGTGSGTFEFSTPEYADEDNTFNAKHISGTWEISGFTAGQAPPLAMPALPDISFLSGPPFLNAPSLSPGNIPAIAGLSIAGAAAGLALSQALAAVAASRAAATLPGGIVAGTRIGPGAELDWGGGTQAPAPALPPGQARSPVDGSLVPADQARHEQAQLDAGYTYDPQRDAFVYVPEQVEQYTAGPSYLTLQAQREQAARQVVRDQQQRARAQRIRAEQIREEMAWQEQEYQRYDREIQRCNNAILVLKTVEFVADVGVSTVAHFVPVAGPLIERGYTWIKIGAAGTSAAYYEGGGAGSMEITKRIVSKVISDRFKPPGAPTFQPEQLFTKMGGEVLKEHVIETTQDLVVSTGVDYAHQGVTYVYENGQQLITGTP